MKAKLAALFAIVLALLIGVPLLTTSAHEGGPHLRVAHLSPGSPAVDVYVNGKLAFDGLLYKDVTKYAGVEGEEFSVVIVPAGGKPDKDSITKDPIKLTFKEGDSGFYTVAAVGSLKEKTFDVILLPADGPAKGEEHSDDDATMAATSSATMSATKSK